jgi:YVTN family beta-propeller protein
MTTRRQFLTLLGAGAAAGLAGCDQPGRQPLVGATPDSLLVRTQSGGVVVLADRTIVRYGECIVAPTGSQLFRAVPVEGGTEVHTVTIRTGVVGDKTVLPGDWVPRVASVSGRSVVLTPPGAPLVGGVPAGRDRTTMKVVGPMPDPLTLDLPGNYVPDAFTSTDEGLFVLDWMPPMTPDRYRVRLVRLTDGQPTALWSRDKVPIPPNQEERMEGRSRLAVYNPNLSMLYTLYTNQHPSGQAMVENAKAFVHSLSIDQQWAVCVDLEEPFGEGPADSHVLTVSPDGRNLYVADLSGGNLAIADTESLRVTSVVPVGKQAGTAFAVATSTRVFVAAGKRIAVLDRMGRPTAAIAVDDPVTGLALSPDGQRLYVARPERLVWYDPATGVLRGEAAVPGLTQLLRVL